MHILLTYSTYIHIYIYTYTNTYKYLHAISAGSTFMVVWLSLTAMTNTPCARKDKTAGPPNALYLHYFAQKFELPNND